MSNNFIGSSFDSFLEEEDIKEEVEIGAVKKVLAYQLKETIQELHWTKSELANRLETSRAAVDRLLDPENDAVTLHTLKKAASLLGKHIKLELV
jgi:DNA-binding Xre family transcriptional regulator